MSSKWEYRVAPLGAKRQGLNPEQLQDFLNESAEANWELSEILPDPRKAGIWVILRRRTPTRKRKRSQSWAEGWP